MRKLNLKFLLLLIALLVVSAGGMVLAHHLQSQRIPRAILRQAKRAEDQGDLRRAAVYVSRYLEFVPNDNEAWARLALLLADKSLAKTFKEKQRAFLVLRRALAHNPQSHHLRERAISLAISLNRMREADEQLTILKTATAKKDPNTHPGTTAGLQGQYHEALEKYDKAIGYYLEATEASPKKISNYERYAHLAHQHGLPGPEEKFVSPKAILNRMIAANPKSWQARVARWDYYREHFSTEIMSNAEFKKYAIEDIAVALDQGKGQPEVRLAAAQFAQRKGDLEEAESHLAKALQLHRTDPRIYRARCGVWLQRANTLKDPEEKAKARTKAKFWLKTGIGELKGADQFEVLWAYATMLLDHGDIEELDEASKVIAQIRKTRTPASAVEFLQGRLLYARQQWSTAAQMFERSRGVLSTNRDLARQIDLLLGRCYVQLDQPSLQYRTWQRLATRNPNSVVAHYGMANAARALGKTEDALQHYQRVLELKQAPRGAWSEQARLLIAAARQSQNPARWERVEKVLDQAEAHFKTLTDATERKLGEIETTIVRAEMLMARGDMDQADQILSTGQLQFPDRVELRIARASLAEVRHDPEESLRILTEAHKELTKPGEQVALRLALARYWVSQDNEKSKAELDQLTQGIDQFDGTERNRLLSGLAEAQYRAGNLDKASELWEELAKEKGYSTDLRLRLVLFDLALHRGNDLAMQKVLKDIRLLEGGDGTFSRHASALRLLWQVREGRAPKEQHKQLLDQAERKLDEVTLTRPDWAALYIAKAQIEEVRGNSDRAINYYVQAREKGDRNPLVVRHLVQAYRKQKRFEEANRELQNLTTEQLLQGQLAHLAANVYLENARPDQAVQLALGTVKNDSRDYRDHLWLGQLLARSGQRLDVAEARLRQAVQLAPEEADPYLSLIALLKQQDQDIAALGVLTRAKANLGKDRREHTLARANEILENPKAALEHYQAAIQAGVESPRLWKDFASFHLSRGELNEAEPLLRRMMKKHDDLSEDDQQWTRSNLALVLSTGTSWPRFEEALALVGLELNHELAIREKPLPTRMDRVQLDRVQARVLATQPGWKTRDAAVEKLEDLQRRRALTVEDHFLLAQLYEAQGNWANAREQLGLVVRARNPRPRHLAYYVEHLLLHREIAQGKQLLASLEQFHKKRPTYSSAVTLTQLQARWHEANNEPEKAEQLLQERLKAKESKPKEIMLLVGFYVRQKRIEDARKLLDQIWETCSVEVAGGTSVALLREVSATEDQRADVVQRLEKAIEENPKNAVLRVQLGDVYDLGGDYQKAEKLYREAIEIEPKQDVALNNLAWLLAQRTQNGQEALKLINQAIAAHGPRGELLDTRAIAYLSMNQWKPAVRDLEEAIKEKKTAMRSFHLARAYQVANQRKEVARHLREAVQLKLTLAKLHPVEQKIWQDMLKEYPAP